MTRKVVTKRLEAVAGMRSNLRSCGAAVVHPLSRRPPAPSGAESAYRLVFEHLHAELAAVESALQAAERVETGDQLELEERKSEHRRAKSSLECRHRRIQRFLIGFFQADDLAPFRVAGAMPKDVFALARKVRTIIDFLRQLDLAVTPPILEVSFDADAMAAQLEADAGRLRTATAGLEHARHALAAARDQTEKACAEANRVGSSIASLLAGLDRLAHAG